jgi:CBS domain containing-hemolysin-like protein
VAVKGGALEVVEMDGRRVGKVKLVRAEGRGEPKKGEEGPAT